ncbi:putative periplasmic nitrate reductase [Crassisporium funariophilum]|nr:putative periplasmic nitrate reductase [Crassisporium funariophilum]
MPTVETRDAIEDIWGPRCAHGPTIRGDNVKAAEWPVRVDQSLEGEPDKWVQSVCIMCSNGCGLDIGVKNNRIVGVRGRAIDRVNKGRLGPKGMYSWQANHSADRLTYPQIRKDGKLVRATWEEAMGLVVSKSREVMERLTNHGLAFYTSGQLFLEEYYTLATIGKAGLGSLHMDGNTRLCTATAAASMRESFGSDGQPGSYADIDVADCIFLVGHNMAATQTVLWSRILDRRMLITRGEMGRLASPNAPKVIVVDPRLTDTAKKATLHLAPRVGTNQALLNGIQHLLFKNNYVDAAYIEKHTIGVEELKAVVSKYTPEYTSQVTGVPPAQLLTAATIIGTAKRLLSTVLQGVYQSHQATASACQVNNINLIRGMIGRPGAGVMQMNGQPTAQNNRETGCDGEYPGFRNPQNMNHMKDLAEHWNIDVDKVPHWGQPTHIMQMLKFMEEGTIQFLWISGTNPAVSLPELERIRRIFTKEDLFIVVQDIFPTETTEFADVVLPAAMWGEKTGCYTNVDRTVHISYKAVDPPGECKTDLEIFSDYAKRMDFRDKDGQPLVYWKDPEGAFEAWKKSTAGRPCDYTGLSYAKLTGGSGVQWPCNKDTCPDGTERLYEAGVFPVSPWMEEFCHDLETGAPYSLAEYKQFNPAGRAILKSAHHTTPPESPTPAYPYFLTTGRSVYHFHTRTKTGRADRLRRAGGEGYVQMHAEDAGEVGVSEGEEVLVESRRGKVQVPVRVGGIEKGVVFVPFHYGSFNHETGETRAANELTQSGWDPVSKQPYFKGGAVRIQRVDDVHIHERHPELALHRNPGAETQPVERRQHLGDFICLYEYYAETIHTLYTTLIDEHQDHYELRTGLLTLHAIAKDAREALAPSAEKYRTPAVDRARANVDALRGALFPPAQGKPTSGAFTTMVHMHGLYTILGAMEGILEVLRCAAAATFDAGFVGAVKEGEKGVRRQKRWVSQRLTVDAVQTLVVPSGRDAGEL